MATYFKYAERSADSQINWAEVGRNMTDMLQNEVAIREEKKAAIDAASRQFGEDLANFPQGEHKGMNQWALEYGDNASQYLLMQDRLLKSGLLKPKDYVVTRQNLIDGTKQAFDLTKEFQTTYASKMERYKNGESQDLELWLNAQAEKFGDFTKSQLYINPTNGTVNVAMKERQIIDGKEVFAMNKNPNEFATIASLRSAIKGTYDKFDTNAVTTAFADSLGKQETSTIVFGTLSRGGAITTIEDIKSRVDLDEDGKSIMFNFIDAENQMITAALENPYDRLSVLTNTKKFAPNNKQYTFTYDEQEAKNNPEKILLRIDSATGQNVPEFTEEQMNVSNEAMRTEVRAKYDFKKSISTTPQAQLQESSQGAREARAGEQEKEAAAGAWNQLYTGKTAAEKRSAAEILLGTPIAQQSGLLGIDLVENGKIKLTYLNPAKNRTINYIDDENKPISLEDHSALGVELHGVVDRDKAVKAAGSGTGFGDVRDLSSVIAQREGEPPQPVVFTAPLSAITQESEKASTVLQSSLPVGFKVKDLGGKYGNEIEVTAPDGSIFKYTSKKGIVASGVIKKDLEDFVKTNSIKGGGASQFNPPQ